MVRLYWDIGRLIGQRQEQEGWGAAVIPRLARELRNELPEVKGFSERNMKRMLAFFREYSAAPGFVPQAVAQTPAPKARKAGTTKVPQAVAQIGPALDALEAVLQALRRDLPSGEKLDDVFAAANRWREHLKAAQASDAG